MILIEGLPGTGKSTLAKSISDYFISHGREVVLHLETEKDSPFRFKDGTSLDVNFDEFCSTILSKWKKYINTSSLERKLIIQESLTIQQQVNFSTIIERFDEAKKLVIEIFSLLDSETKLIYLSSSDPKAHFEKTMKIRGSEWVEKTVRPISKTLWASKRGLTHPDSALELVTEVSKNTESILNEFPFKVLRINVDSSNWVEMEKECIAFIEK